MSGFLGQLVISVLSPEQNQERGSDRQLFQLTSPFIFESEKYGRILVPAGFVTDFASIPSWALVWMDDDAPEILRASVIHDFLYSTLGTLPDRQFSRREADEVLREGMLASGARAYQAWIVFKAVNVGGASHWKI